MNAVPDESSLDVLLDSAAVAGNLAYGTSTGYQSTNPVPTRLRSSLQDRPRRCCNSPSRLRPARTRPSFPTIFLKHCQPGVWPITTPRRLREISSFAWSTRRPTRSRRCLYCRARNGSEHRQSHPEQCGLWFGRRLPVSGRGELRGGAHRGRSEIDRHRHRFDFAQSGQVRTLVGTNSQSGGFSYTLLQDVN